MNRKTKLGLLLVILLAALLGIATKTMYQGADPVGSKSPDGAGMPSEAQSDGGGKKTERSPRTMDSGSKLRSLLDVRKGEIAALSVPPEFMKSFLSTLPPDGEDGATAVDPNTPRIVGVFNREMSLQLLKPVESSVKGVVDASEGSFEWSMGKLKVSGDAFFLGSEDATRLHVNVLKDGNGIECITRIPDGKCLLLSSGGENPEGILIVAGSRGEAEAAEKQPPSTQ